MHQEAFPQAPTTVGVSLNPLLPLPCLKFLTQGALPQPLTIMAEDVSDLAMPGITGCSSRCHVISIRIEHLQHTH